MKVSVECACKIAELRIAPTYNIECEIKSEFLISLSPSLYKYRMSQ